MSSSVKIPNHIAFIMDGNGRWAQHQNKPRTFGHKKGVESLRNIVTYCQKIGVKHVSAYAFSTENWNRSKVEVSFLINLIFSQIEIEISNFMKNNVKVLVIGNRSTLSKTLQKSFDRLEAKTSQNDGIQLNLLFNYGSRNEIIHACQNYAQDFQKNPNLIMDESLFNDYLLTKTIPDPDIMIRTSGEQRLSNFLLWQLSYSELFFVDTLWPDFKNEHLDDVINQFNNRDRRFGGH
ncbi:isoprenyl transferase [Candidatus Marinamargulisbacteria bacterium SCGC AG-410-N11]|nr:isoprenyl transferase [Candidatus Marinamargulisbacteria bacterium SCGC AG-410-N11]